MLRGNQTLFATSLKTAREWLDEYVDPEHAATQRMAQDLDRLASLDIEQPLPDISGSLARLLELQRLRTDPAPPSNRGSQGESPLFGLRVAAVVIGGLLGSLIVKDAGYVMIAYDKAIFETSVWFALFAILALWALVRVLFTLAQHLLQGRADVANWVKKRRETAANRRTEQGVLHVLEGRWADARKALTDVAANAATPIVNYLGAARAAHELGDAAGRDRLLDLAGGAASGASLAAGLTRAQLLAGSGQWRECLETLESLYAKSPSHPRVSPCCWPAMRNLGTGMPLSNSRR